MLISLFNSSCDTGFDAIELSLHKRLCDIRTGITQTFCTKQTVGGIEIYKETGYQRFGGSKLCI